MKKRKLNLLERRIFLALERIFAGESCDEAVTMPDDGRKVRIFVKDGYILPVELKMDKLFFETILHCFRKIIAEEVNSEEVFGPGKYRFCVSLV